MEKGQIFEVVIEDMSSEGQGIGRAEGLVVFVPGAVVGDKAQVCLTKVKKNYAFSRLLEITEPSADRTEDFDCEFLEDGCGGCPYGHLGYDAQVKVKERQVKEKLQRLAGLEQPLVRPIIAMDESDNEGFGPFRYRNKAQFPVSTGGIITRKGGAVENLGEPAVGFYRAKSHEVVDCGDCYLQSMAAMAAADALRRFMAEDNITAWDPKWQKGLMRHLIVKTAFATKEVMVILVINGKGIPNSQKLIEMLDEAVYDVGYSLESVVLNVKKSGNDDSDKSSKQKNPGNRKKIGQEVTKDDMIFRSGEIMGDESIILAGKPVIRDIVGQLEFEISPESFYQVNPVQMKRLYDKVREYCGFGDIDRQSENEVNEREEYSCAEESRQINFSDDECSRTTEEDVTKYSRGELNQEKAKAYRDAKDEGPIVLDLYCGVGSIGLYCADKAGAVIGIESVKNAVLDANRNAVVNGIVNARYICGRAEEVLPGYVKAARCENSSYGDELSLDTGGIESIKTEDSINDNGTNNNVVKSNALSDSGAKKIDPQIAEMIRNADIAILDPPRAGCRPELLEAVANMGVDRIVYVSCDPATLARDIKLLGEMRYEFKEATPVDMFPWTGHCEVIALLQKVTK